MKIAVDGLIIDKKKAGIGQYGYNLIEELKNNKDYEFTFILQEFLEHNYNNSIKRKNYVCSKERIIDEQLILPSKYNSFDLIHFLDYSSPLIPMNVPFIVTIHDLAYYKYPDTFSKGSLLLKKILSPISIKRAAQIITVSDNTKCDILEYFDVPSEKINVIYPAVKNFKRESDMEKIRSLKEKYGIKGKYILGVGTIEPRKNLIRLVRAFKNISYDFNDFSLVLIGKKGWLTEPIFKEFNDEKIKDKIIFTDYVPQKDMSFLYSAADIFVYPSIYEGFGLPPLEAMSCGTPVIVSDNSSLQEVVGSAGVYVNALSTESIENGIRKLLNDENLKLELIEKGYEQSKKFNWENTYKEVLKVYKKILEGK